MKFKFKFQIQIQNTYFQLKYQEETWYLKQNCVTNIYLNEIASEKAVCRMLVILKNYRQTSNISRTKSPNVNVSRLVLKLALFELLKPCFKSRMKM